GGIMDPVPVRLVKEMGADVIIAVNVLPKIDHQEPKPHHHTIFSIMLKTMYIFNNKVIETSLSGADIVILPNTSAIGYTDFQKVEDCIQEGRKATELMLPKIKKKLGLVPEKVTTRAV
ncbi:MAG: hypothetical protein PHE50_07325, partial [Dehalococcoidales bacterium]|nr:hypothetical protein [Dehalococcoidales bacterium]